MGRAKGPNVGSSDESDTAWGAGVKSPYNTPDTNWTDILTPVGGAWFYPDRLWNLRPFRSLFASAGILLLILSAIEAIQFGLTWTASGLGILGATIIVSACLRRFPLWSIFAVACVVVGFFLPKGADSAARSAAASAVTPTCRLLPSSEVSNMLGPSPNVNGRPIEGPRCSWRSSARATASSEQLGTALSITLDTPQAIPIPPAGARMITTLGLLAWTTTTCVGPSCEESLLVVLSGSDFTLDVSSQRDTSPTRPNQDSARLALLQKLGTEAVARINAADSPPMP
jgi:hypothetical protein